MWCTLLFFSFFIYDPFYLNLHVISVRFHDLNRLAHRKFISLFDLHHTVFNLFCDSKICVLPDIGVAVINLCLFRWFSKEKSSCKLPIGTIRDLVQIPRHILPVKLRIFLIIINCFPVCSRYSCHIQSRFHSSFDLEAVNPRIDKLRNMFDHAEVF